MKRAITLIVAASIILSCVSFPALAESTIPARASKTISYYIDNDTSNTANCYNIRSGYTAYIKDSDYYNGDLRRTYSSSRSDTYSWMRKTSFANVVQYSPIYLTIGVYLKSTVLSDSAARYWCSQHDAAYIMFSLNQSTNANGWSYHTYTLKTNAATSGWYSIRGVEVMPSGTGSGYSAADAIYVYASTSR